MALSTWTATLVVMSSMAGCVRVLEPGHRSLVSSDMQREAIAASDHGAARGDRSTGDGAPDGGRGRDAGKPDGVVYQCTYGCDTTDTTCKLYCTPDKQAWVWCKQGFVCQFHAYGSGKQCSSYSPIGAYLSCQPCQATAPLCAK